MKVHTRLSILSMTSKQKKIIFVTNNRLEHPRTKMYLDVLSAHHGVSVIQHTERSFLLRVINFLCFGKNFELGCLAHFRQVRNHDVVIVQNTQMLPLAFIGKLFGRNVIFDSLDVTPYLNEYTLSKKYPYLAFLFGLQRIIFEIVEKKIVASSCRIAFCNSRFLARHFRSNGVELLYSSYLEGLANRPENTPALLYLGVFSPEKGAHETLALARRLGAKLFIFGEVQIEQMDKSCTGITLEVFSRLNQEDLKKELVSILSRYFLWGVSLIDSRNYSYAVQEANKDIDYLAMGVPILGNLRDETRRKIAYGAGMFVDDMKLEKAFHDEAARKKLSGVAKDLYARNYQSRLFESRVLNAVSSLADQSRILVAEDLSR